LFRLHAFLDGGIDGSPRVAFAHDLSGDALADFALAATVRKKRVRRPTEHVDEAGGDGEIVGIHHGFGSRLCQIADERDAITLDAQVGSSRRIARAIINQSLYVHFWLLKPYPVVVVRRA